MDANPPISTLQLEELLLETEGSVVGLEAELMVLRGKLLETNALLNRSIGLVRAFLLEWSAGTGPRTPAVEAAKAFLDNQEMK